MIYCVDGCNDRKCQERGLLAIMNFRGAAFYFLMSWLFSCVFVVCMLWALVWVLHGVLTLRSTSGDGALFRGFSFIEWGG